MGSAAHLAQLRIFVGFALPETVVAMSGFASENCSASFAISTPRAAQCAAAWRAVLGGLKGQTLPDASSPAAPTMTALTKFARAFGPADSAGNDPWTQYRELSEAQIDELAGRVVEEVRIRGPFMSLGDFINRRLVNNDTFGLKGALQAAIDKSPEAVFEVGGTIYNVCTACHQAYPAEEVEPEPGAAAEEPAATADG